MEGGADEPPGDAPVPGEADLVSHLTRWLAEQRADDAAGARARERWLRQQAEEEGTFAGVLLDLAERARPVLLATGANRRVRGRLLAVGHDFCLLRSDRGATLMVAHRAVSSMRLEPHARPLAGDRVVVASTGLIETLAGLAGTRPRALVVTMAGEALAGVLRAVGTDVLTLRLDGDPPATVYVPAASVAEVSLAEGSAASG